MHQRVQDCSPRGEHANNGFSFVDINEIYAKKKEKEKETRRSKLSGKTRRPQQKRNTTHVDAAALCRNQ
jgi:hypothetical protein